MHQRFSPCFFAHFKNQLTGRTDDELGFIVQHKKARDGGRLNYFLVFHHLLVLMIKVYNNSMVRPNVLNFLKTIVFSEKMKLYLFQFHSEFETFIQSFISFVSTELDNCVRCNLLLTETLWEIYLKVSVVRRRQYLWNTVSNILKKYLWGLIFSKKINSFTGIF